MSRVLALIAAVALIAGAYAFRQRLDATAEPVDGPDQPVAGLTLACAAELEDACAELDADRLGLTVEVAAAGETAAAIVEDPAAAPDLWLVPAPWPEVTRIRAEQAGAPVQVAASEVLARSPLILVGFDERLDALDPVCIDGVAWRCLGDQAGTAWADLGVTGAGSAVVRPGHLDPTESGTGLLVLGAAVSSWAGRSDLNRGDLDSEVFAAWFDRLESNIPEFSPASGSQVTDMVTRGVASYDVVGTTEAEALPLLDSARAEALGVLASEPAASADVVLVALDGALPETLAEPLRAALSASGWRTDDEPVSDGVPLPQDTGLPSAGFLVALQDRWEEVAE